MIKVGILDSTLREGEQTPGVIFTVDQRVEIAKALSDLGVSMIEAGHPAVSPDIYEGIKRIVKLKKEGIITSEIVGHSRAVKRDIEIAAELEVDRIAIFYGVSDLHLKAKHKATREEALRTIAETISYAKNHGVKVRFTAEDGSRTDFDFLVTVSKTARDAGADRVSIADTVGILYPSKTKELFSALTREVPNLEFDIHAHNDLGLAVANALAAIEGGATIIHATVNGLGERVGIVPLQQIAAAIKYHFGIEVVKLDKLQYVSSLVEKYSGIPMPPNYPITGDYAFLHKAGVHVAGVLNDPRTYEFMPPETFGRTRDYTIDKYTGKHALRDKYEKLGVKISDAEMDQILAKIKSNTTIRFYRDVDLLELAEEVTGRVLKPRPPEQIEALISVKCDSNVYTTSVTRRLSVINGVKEVMEISGDYDILVKVQAKDSNELNQIIESIRATKGVRSTLTSLVLKKM
ncbi:transcriptional regulator, AsnC family [Sulfolobus islandicus Y.G.57.14]|jgi:homocitrate synthase|uniref:Homocitrate synthase n=7 Tax=Saccharolobus TaxID=2100760 RepID=HOSA_SACI1|nr:MULTISPECIES: homocitrate synthase [Sulfolobaceae]C3MYM1.1 RecName: Full=Homocitrate synthase; Short=HCS [Sulfolobus islandicus M.14.25]C3N5A3.1 RecName: Full=Homocitrate synthase; Short=HCS [Sulfolobus islandicus M.16.27]C3NDV7.1 RecName: Full=Homocitrate synthase; Short=HCS [Sulfolobus islandicus Y.G.57.14]C3NHU6.1 RecName: Full=Homocitrate synthase; Short=HCS [Sulfolobus islandicus Y.N.15.51]C4KGW9.1 RecName: Full=Homocitrate synthase; Short=HCS [Sulfolobus islandicus M.16.4]ACP38000.1 